MIGDLAWSFNEDFGFELTLEGEVFSEPFVKHGEWVFHDLLIIFGGLLEDAGFL